jgi:site-specific DNA-cytosine methylase
VLEFYCGIGGLATAIPNNWEVVAAVDQNQLALSTYRNNFGHPTFAWNIVGLSADRLRHFEADLWWMSPPCRPFTQRGPQADVADARCESFLNLISLIGVLKPPALGIENVPGFVGSQAQQRLFSALETSGYTWWDYVICPTEWGIPNRRLRYYLVASLGDLGPRCVPVPVATGLLEHLHGDQDPRLLISEATLEAYVGAMHVIEPEEESPITNCFTSAYGRSWVRSGSYLREGEGVRRFSPGEILSLLGFPDSFSFPASIQLEQRWALVGNSLSVSAVRSILSPLERADV